MKQFVILLLALMLVACGSDTEPTGVAQSVEERTEEAADTQLGEDAEATVAPTEDVAEVAEDSAESTPESSTDTVAADQAETDESADTVQEDATDAIIPITSAQDATVTRAGDYYKGAEAPDVVLVEYGDFQ